MNAVILTQTQYEELVNHLEDIKQKLNDPQKTFSEQYLDNSDFIRMMKISPRTAQTWRDEGLISFSQIGKKIYYKIADVEAFIEKHHKKAFKLEKL